MAIFVISLLAIYSLVNIVEIYTTEYYKSSR